MMFYRKITTQNLDNGELPTVHRMLEHSYYTVICKDLKNLFIEIL